MHLWRFFMSEKMFDNFTNLFQVTKTLKFSLIPQGETEKWIKEKGLIVSDQQGNVSGREIIRERDEYPIIKEILDEEHRKFIDRSLKNYEIEDGLLEKLDNNFDVKNERTNIFKEIREKIVENFKNQDDYKEFSATTPKDLLKRLSKESFSQEEEKAINSFSKFNTHLSIYQTSRNNMYKSDGKATAIATRLVDENLLLFVENKNRIREVISPQIVDNTSDSSKSLLEIKDDLESISNIDFYNKCLTQAGIDKYNEIIGRINLAFNEYNQNLKKKNNDLKNAKKISNLKILRKMILSDRSDSVLEDSIDNDEDLIDTLRKCIDKITENQFLQKEQTLVNKLNNDNSKILLNYKKIDAISNHIFNDYSIIKNILEDKYDHDHSLDNQKTNKYEGDKNKYFNQLEFLDLPEMNFAIEKFIKQYDDKDKIKHNPVHELLKDEFNKIKENIDHSESKIVQLFKKDTGRGCSIRDDDNKIETIKAYLDSLLSWSHYNEYFYYDGYEDIDIDFYLEMKKIHDFTSNIFHLYNQVRNYITKKPYSVNKYRLAFDAPSFLDGWAKSNESTNLGVLLFKDNKYYLGIMSKDLKNRKTLFEGKGETSSTSTFRKINYHQCPDPKKDFPKNLLPKKNITKFNPSEEVVKIITKSRKKDNKKPLTKHECHVLIDFYKEALDVYDNYKIFNFRFRKTSEYENIQEFSRMQNSKATS